MAVAAGSEHRMGAVTFFTLVNGHAAALSTAVNDGINHFSVFIWHGIAEAADIFWCVLSKNQRACEPIVYSMLGYAGSFRQVAGLSWNFGNSLSS